MSGKVTELALISAIEWLESAPTEAGYMYRGQGPEMILAVKSAAAIDLVAAHDGWARIKLAGRAALRLMRAYHARELARKESET